LEGSLQEVAPSPDEPTDAGSPASPRGRGETADPFSLWERVGVRALLGEIFPAVGEGPA
jgi:hypothetical protein